MTIAPNELRTFYLSMTMKEDPQANFAYINEISENKKENKVFLVENCVFMFFKTRTPFRDIILNLGNISKNIFFLSDVTDNDFSFFLPTDVSEPLMQFLGKSKINFKTKEIVDLSEASIEQLQLILQQAIQEENFEYCSEIKKIILDKSK